MAFVPGGHSYELPECRLQLRKIRAFSGVYTDAYDDGAILHCFKSLYLCDCTVRLLHVLSKRLKIEIKRVSSVGGRSNPKSPHL